MTESELIDGWTGKIFTQLMEICPKINAQRQAAKIDVRIPLVYYVCSDNLDLHDEEVQDTVHTALKRKCRSDSTFFQEYKDSKHFDESWNHISHEYESLFDKSPLEIFFKPA